MAYRLEQLRTVRQNRLLTQRELGQQAGVNVTTIIRAEQGGLVYASTLKKLASALQVEPQALM